MIKIMVKRTAEKTRFTALPQTFRDNEIDAAYRFAEAQTAINFQVQIKSDAGFYGWHEVKTFTNGSNARFH